MDIVGAVEKLVGEVQEAAKDKREAALWLKQAAVTFEHHLQLARNAAGEEQAAEDVEQRASGLVPVTDVDLRAEQKASAAAKMAAKVEVEALEASAVPESSTS